MASDAPVAPRSEHVTCDDGWPALFLEDDVYCRMCGTRLLDDRLEPADLLFVLAPNGTTRPASLTIDNGRSLRPLRLTFAPTHPALRVDGMDGVVEIAAGARREVRVWLEGQSLDAIVELRTDLRFRVGQTAVIRRVPVRIGSTPSFAAELPVLQLALPGSVTKGVGRLRQVGGVGTAITRISCNHPAFSQTGLHVGEELQVGTELPFEVSCDASGLQPGRHQALLTIEGTGPWSHAIPLGVEVIKPARLTIALLGKSREISHRLVAERTLVIHNEGGVDLDVETIVFPNRPAWFSLDLVELPAHLPPNGALRVRCEIDASELELGEHHVDVGVSASRNIQTARRLAIPVVELPVYEHFVAIDFGTTNSCVAYFEPGGVRMVPFRTLDGSPSDIVPSAAYFDEEQRRWLVGFEAVELMMADPQGGVRSVKRLLNQDRIRDTGRNRLEIRGRSFTPEEVATEVFRFLKRRTEQHLQKAIDHVMITVPANFTDTGVLAIIAAARAAGLRPFQADRQQDWHDYRIDEPTAAALETALASPPGGSDQRFVMIFDFGGGTLDVSILRITLRDDLRQIEVLANKGANWLGGDDFTARMIRLIADGFERQLPQRLRYDVRALQVTGDWWNLLDSEQAEVRRNFQNLWEAAEQTKIELSRTPDAEDLAADVQVELTVDGSRVALKTAVTRSAFEAVVDPLVTKAVEIVDRTVRRAARQLEGFTLSGIDQVVLTGSASLVPLVRRRLKEHIGSKFWSPYEGFSEKACVARGACHYGRHKLGSLTAPGQAPLEIVGIHEQTNCSYGFGASESDGLAQRFVFREIIPEGTRFSQHNGNGPRTLFKGVPALIPPVGFVVVPLFQHTGDPLEPHQAVIDGNPDVTAIDRIVISGVHVKDRRQPPLVEVTMWLASDGLLDAEAIVEGHAAQFRPERRQRSLAQ